MEVESVPFDEMTNTTSVEETETVMIKEISVEALKATGNIKGKDYVDLGLDVVWATCNVGACSPEEFGDFYAWGELKTKPEYTVENSITREKDINDITGNSEYDVARAQWGGLWRMPTKQDFEELEEHCTYQWAILNNVTGCLLTSKKNGNSIFLPAAGFRRGTTHRAIGEGYYWSSTDTPYGMSNDFIGSEYLSFYSGGMGIVSFQRNLGLCVRPVIE